MDQQPGKSMMEAFEANLNNDLNNRFKEASLKVFYILFFIYFRHNPA